MDSLDTKVVNCFKGKVVRKDLTALMKKTANVPTFVLEYLLGMYCATDDEEIIKLGLQKIEKILSQNYVKPEQSEYIKSKIRENGKYSIIDKIYVHFNEVEDKYIAHFTNLKIAPFVVSSDLVIHNEKLLLGGVWCLIGIEYKTSNDDLPLDQETITDVFGFESRVRRRRRGKNQFASPFSIFNIRPIQMPDINIEEIIDNRKEFEKDEWVSLLLRSTGYEPNELTPKQKLHYLLRIVPLIQKNYNLVELGPRGTGKSHVYSEVSPYSILISGGSTTASNLFCDIRGKSVGLVGTWDTVAFDEVSGMSRMSDETIQILKNYMANGTFARGKSSINAEASLALEGNTFKSVEEMIKTTHLFEPFPQLFNDDSAFFDRVHAFLPGWETPKLKTKYFTKGFGLICDCLAEFCHSMRKYDYSDRINKYFTLNSAFNVRDEIGVRRTFSGLAKLIYPDGKMNKNEVKELLEYAIECRRRVKEQLKKMTPNEFDAVNLGYIDIKTNEETIIELPEQRQSLLISEHELEAGVTYAVGRSVLGKMAIYRLENRLIHGTGQFNHRNVEGVGRGQEATNKSLTAAFNYFKSEIRSLSRLDVNNFDYTLFFNDLQQRGVSDEISVAEVVGLASALLDISVKPSTVIAGKVVMSGNIMPLNGAIEEVISSAINAGAKLVLLPLSWYSDKVEKLTEPDIEIRYYSNPIDAAKIALELRD